MQQMLTHSEEMNLQEKKHFKKVEGSPLSRLHTRLLYYSTLFLKSAFSININNHILKALHTRFSDEC